MVASQPAGRPNNRHEPCDVAVGVTVHAGYKVGGGSGGGGEGMGEATVATRWVTVCYGP